jgi:putative phage-type endonuclease
MFHNYGIYSPAGIFPPGFFTSGGSAMSQAQPAGSGKTRPALRLVETKNLAREDWLEVRKSGIGSSDAAAAVGLNLYMSALELWQIKTGSDAGLPKPDSDDTTEPVYWGTLLEPIVAASYTKQTGNKVRRVNAVLQHPAVPFMLANVDREVVGNRDVQLQVQHQLAVWRQLEPPPATIKIAALCRYWG